MYSILLINILTQWYSSSHLQCEHTGNRPEASCQKLKDNSIFRLKMFILFSDRDSVVVNLIYAVFCSVFSQFENY